MSNLKKLVQNLSPLSEPSEYIISGYIFLNEVCNLWAALHFYLLHSSKKMILVGDSEEIYVSHILRQVLLMSNLTRNLNY